MSRYSATITLGARDGSMTRSICDSIRTDDAFYPENPVRTSISMSGRNEMAILSESDNLAHLRANLNSTLRLIQACRGSIAESVASKDARPRKR